jgi:glycosyltransferase involved in cell wall biosynthesis
VNPGDGGAEPAAHRPRILVILPRGQGPYVDRELYRLVPGFEAVYASEEPQIGTLFRVPAQVVRIRYAGFPRSFGTLGAALSRVHHLEQLLDEIRPAVVVTFELFTRTTDQVSRARARFGFLHVVTAYETTDRASGLWGRFPWTRILAGRNAPRVDLVVAASRRTEAALVKLGVPPGKMVRIRPSVFASEFSETDGGRRAGPPTILYVGALRKNKGLPTLIAALDSLHADNTRPERLVIAGSGPLAGWIQQQALQRDWLRFEGPVDERRKAALLAEASVFVYPSEDIRLWGLTRWEEQGALSVVEAMMSGLPIVCSDSGALPEIVLADNFRFPQRSRAGLAQALDRALRDLPATHEIGHRNRARAEREFDLPKNAVLLGQALTPLLGAR